METDDVFRQLIWDLRCAAAPKCADCGVSIYTYDTYTQIGAYQFCERCMRRSVMLQSCDLELH